MSSENDKIEAAVIFEIIGKPKEHLVQTLEKIIENVGAEKGVKIKEKKIEEPKELEKNKEMFITFAEIIADFDSVLDIYIILFKYMPAHIQIIYPEKIILRNNELNEVINELARRLHSYDEVARVIQYEKKILEKKLKDVLGKKEEKIENEDEEKEED